MSEELKVGQCAICGGNLAQCHTTVAHSHEQADGLQQMINSTYLKIEDAKDNEIRRLRSALEKYGRHISDGLPFSVAGHTDGACLKAYNKGDCVCGFSAALGKGE